jgi:tetratricopeptide (TPR) repeat protein
MRPKLNTKNPGFEGSDNADPLRMVRRWLGSKIAISGALALLTLVVFLPVVRNEFVNYDDADYVTANQQVQDALTWDGIKWAFTTGHASNWHPLTWLSHMVDCQLFGQRAWAHHLVSVLLHCTNAVLLFLLLDSITAARWRSAFVAALFALHPLHVESVAWASERKDVLCALFVLLTIWVWKEYARRVGSQRSAVNSPDGTGQDRPRGSRSGKVSSREETVFSYVLSFALFGCALMSKPMAVTLPFVLLLLDYWPLGRLFAKRKNGSFSRWSFVILEKVPFMVLSLVSCRITYLVQQRGGAVSTSVTSWARLENAVVAYAMYLRNMFWPHGLAVLYPHPSHWPVGSVIGASGVLLAITVIVVLLQTQRRYLFTGWCWYLGMLVPVIGFVQVGVQSMADRYTYLPLIGVFIMIAWGVPELIAFVGAAVGGQLRRLVPENRQKVALASLGGFCLAACAVLTVNQLEYWQTSETLFGHTAAVTKNNYLAYNNLGYYLSGRGKTEQAMAQYRKALEINPQYEDAYNNMGYALAALKRYPEAIAHYEAALRIRPKHTEVHNNLGNALADTGRIDEAIQHYRIVLAQAPEHADAHNNLGIALAMKGELQEAIEHFQKAIRFKRNYASAHSNLGNAYAVQRKFAEAIAEYRESLRLNPDDAQAHNNLGNALAEQGQLDEAAKDYALALKLNADNPEAHFNLALALVRQGKREDATAHLKEALRLKPTYEEARKQLALIEGKTE